MKKSLIYIVLVVFLLSLSACNENDPDSNENLVDQEEDFIIRVGILESYEPYIYSKDGLLQGPYVDIIKAIMDQTGQAYEIVPLPWSRLLAGLENGSVHMGLPLYEKTERRQIIYYGEEPIGFSRLSFISKKDLKVAYQGDLSVFSDYTIGIVQDYFYSNDFHASQEAGDLSIDVAIDTQHNIDKLLQDRVDFILEDQAVVREYLKSQELEDELYYLDQDLVTDYNHVVFTKVGNLVEVRRAYDKILGQMKADGRLDAIYKQHDMAYYGQVFKSLEKESPPMDRFFYDQSMGPIRIGVLGSTKPYVYYEDDQLTGFAIDYLSEVLNRIGLDYEFVDLPFNRLLEELESGNLHMGSDVYLKSDRQAYLLYPDLPYAAFPTVAFKLKDQDIPYDGQVETLLAYRIGYIRGYYIGQLDPYKADDTYDFFISDSPEQNIDALINGRVDVIVDIESTGIHTSIEMGVDHLIEKLIPPVHFDYSYNVFSKAQDLEKLKIEYNRVVEDLIEDGSLDRLYFKYGLNPIDFTPFKE